MIRDLTAAACDAQKGRYAHTRTRQWATNMSSSGGTTALDVQVWQYQRWRAQNDSGRTVTITQPPRVCHSLARAQRAAVLAVFRDTDGIDFHGTARDRAGRTGIGLSVTSDIGGGRDLLILDPRTGELLAFEMAAMRDPGRLGITEPTVLDYHLFLSHTRTATTGKP